MSSSNSFMSHPVEAVTVLVRNHAEQSAILIAVLVVIVLILLYKIMAAPMAAAVKSGLANYTGAGSAVALQTQDTRGFNEPTYTCSSRAKAVAAAASPAANMDSSSIETVPIVPSGPSTTTKASMRSGRSGFSSVGNGPSNTHTPDKLAGIARGDY